MLHQKESDLRGVVEVMGDTLRAPHMDDDMIRAYFRRRRQVGGAEVLEKFAQEGMQA